MMVDQEIYHTLLELGTLPTCLCGLYVCMSTTSKSAEFKWLSLLFATIGLLNLVHATLPLLGVVASLSFFIPITWLVGKILFPALAWAAISIRYGSPEKLIVAGLLTLTIAVSVFFSLFETSLNSGGLIGRPQELIPVIFCIAALVDIFRKRDSPLVSVIVVLALIWFCISQIIMSFSVEIFDEVFNISHWLQMVYLSMIAIYGWVLSSIHASKTGG